MNFKSCTFERLAFISLGFGRGAQVGKTSLLEVNVLRRKRRRWAYSFFYLVHFRPWDPTKTFDIWYALGSVIPLKIDLNMHTV